MRQEKRLLEMCLLHVCHKRWRCTRRQGGGRRRAKTASGQYEVRRICDQKKANDTYTHINEIPFAEIELWDKQKKIQVEEPYKKEVKGQFVKGVRIKLKPIYRLVGRK